MKAKSKKTILDLLERELEKSERHEQDCSLAVVRAQDKLEVARHDLERAKSWVKKTKEAIKESKRIQEDKPRKERK